MRFTYRLSNVIISLAFLYTTGIIASEAAPEELNYQERMLLFPSESQLAVEQRGRVNIYDSLDIELIDDAMDQHFSRIENMMFIRIRRLPASGAGSAVTEDDGCD